MTSSPPITPLNAPRALRCRACFLRIAYMDRRARFRAAAALWRHARRCHDLWLRTEAAFP